MTLPYFLRLMCVGMAAFSAIFVVTGAAVSLCASAAMRMAERLRPSAAAQLILGLRLLPTGLGCLLVMGVCIPSYVRFEQRSEWEQAGPLSLALSLLTAGLLCGSAVRALRAWQRSRNCEPTFALVGVIRPRIMVSEQARTRLSEAEFAVALSHEQAHAKSCDNLKRLLMILAPGPFPYCRALEETWKKFAEYAADDSATVTDPARCLSLAAALVKVSKLSLASEAPLATSFLATRSGLECRVDRLLSPSSAASPRLMVALSYLGASALAAAILHPATPARVHELLEHLLH
jgi:hypothetical protein